MVVERLERPAIRSMTTHGRLSLQPSQVFAAVIGRRGPVHEATSSFLKVLHEFLDVFHRAFSRHHVDYQPRSRVECHMIPVVTLLNILWFFGVAVLLFFASGTLSL